MNSPDIGTTLKLWHPCGQPVTSIEHMVGYSASFHFVIGGKGVRYCPRCGKRIWYEQLEYDEPCADTINFFDEAHQDEQDTLASLRATW